jgi:hypothetical protein
MQFPVAESYTGVGSVQSFGMGAHTNARGSFPRRASYRSREAAIAAAVASMAVAAAVEAEVGGVYF